MFKVYVENNGQNTWIPGRFKKSVCNIGSGMAVLQIYDRQYIGLILMFPFMAMKYGIMGFCCLIPW